MFIFSMLDLNDLTSPKDTSKDSFIKYFNDRKQLSLTIRSNNYNLFHTTSCLGHAYFFQASITMY